MKAYRITRDIDQKEQPWMDDGDVVRAGEIVYAWERRAYGCISPGGIAVTREHDKTPFFQVPADAVEPVNAHSTAPGDN